MIFLATFKNLFFLEMTGILVSLAASNDALFLEAAGFRTIPTNQFVETAETRAVTKNRCTIIKFITLLNKAGSRKN